MERNCGISVVQKLNFVIFLTSFGLGFQIENFLQYGLGLSFKNS